MGAAALPFNINNGDPLDATQVMANDQAITQVVNGGLEANTNVSTDTAVTQTGAANGEGTAATLARSDHRHLIQGFENLAADPTTGNFKGRVYWNTVTTTLRYCSDATGVGTFLDLTPTATSLVVHAAQHKDGGHDPLADNTITEHMFAAKGTIFSSTLTADTANFSGTGWTSFGNSSDLSVTTTGAQTLGITISLTLQNGSGSNRNAQFRVQDVTASSATIYKSVVVEADIGVQTQLSGMFFYTTPATGARTLRLQGTCSAAGAVLAQASTSVNTETLKTPTIQAVIL